jgi:hypothetical protein
VLGPEDQETRDAVVVEVGSSVLLILETEPWAERRGAQTHGAAIDRVALCARYGQGDLRGAALRSIRESLAPRRGLARLAAERLTSSRGTSAGHAKMAFERTSTAPRILRRRDWLYPGAPLTHSRKLTPSPNLAGFEHATEGVLRDHFSARHHPNHPLFSLGGLASSENFGGGRTPARGAPADGSGAALRLAHFPTALERYSTPQGILAPGSVWFEPVGGGENAAK